jgi:hypothetical protein
MKPSRSTNKEEQILEQDLQSQNSRKKNIVCCISNTKSRLMVDVVVHYMKKSGIDGNFFVLQKDGISQNRFYFSQKTDISIRNQFLRHLNFIPIQSLDMSLDIQSELKKYHQKFYFNPDQGTYQEIISKNSQNQEENVDVQNPNFIDNEFEADIVLFLKDLRIDRHNVRVHSDTEEGIQNMLTRVELFVGGIEKSKVCAIHENKIRYGGASSELIGFLKGYFENLGISKIALQQSWDDSDKDIFIQMQDPSIIGKPLKDWMPLLIACDDSILEQQMVSTFYERGFKKVRMATKRERTQKQLGFTIFENSYKNKDPLGEITTEIQSILSKKLESIVNLQDYPIQIESGSQNHYGCLLHIPIQEYQDGMSPYVGDGVGAYPIKIHTNRPDDMQPLQKKLKEMGYNTYIEHTEESVQVANVSWGLFSKHAQAPALLKTIEEYIQKSGLTRHILKISDTISKKTNQVFGPPIVRDLDNKCINIHVYKQTKGGGRRRNTHMNRRFRVVVNIDDVEPVFHKIREELEEIGIRKIEGRGRIPEAPDDNTVHFGMAPSWLIAQIIAKIERFFDPNVNIQTEETFLSEDRDIYIFLPKNTTRKERNVQAFDPRAWLNQAHPITNQKRIAQRAAGKSSLDEQDSEVLEITPLLGPPCFIQNTEQGKLRIGNQFLDVSARFAHPLTPDIKNFQHYCLDSQTAILCERLCESINYKEPLLLEGVTSTSKTSSILFLASCIGQPTMRINLSGATDVSEFVGRFIPDENSTNNGWRWEDGPIVKAMLEGYWVILDELNLAEPSILERLNSILETNPKLLLSEHNDRLIGNSEYPLHRDFRVFATQNPTTYAGRNPLSPAYRDRFHEIQVKDPNMDPQIIEEMLNWIVFEEAPKIDVFGFDYKGFLSLKNIETPQKETTSFLSDDSEEKSPSITLITNHTMKEEQISEIVGCVQMREMPNIKEFLHYLSIFHASLCSACSEEHMGISALGVNRAGGYAFTRRGLIRLLNYMDHSLHSYNKLPSKLDCDYMFRQALTRTYLERVDSRDAEQVANLLDAAGIGPNTWIV